MKQIFFLLFICSFFIGCTSLKNHPLISGRYSSELSNYIIELLPDKKFIIIKKDSKQMFPCDTISFGSWSKSSSKNFIKLSTDNSINSNVEFIDNVELSQEKSPDSIYIEFNTPIEAKYPNENMLTYNVFLDYSGDIDENNANNNIIVFSKPFSKFELHSAAVEIIYNKPLYSYEGEFLGITSIIIDDFEFPKGIGNYYKVNLSKLDRCYFEFARLNESIVEITNNGIIWRGEKLRKRW